MQAAIYRAFARIKPVHAFHSVAHVIRRAKLEIDMDSPNHQHTVFTFDLSANIGREPAVARIDFARFQRAPEGSNHSACGSRDDVINRRRVRFAECILIDSIVFCDRTMYAELDRRVLTGQFCEAQRSFAPFQVNVRYINNVCHSLNDTVEYFCGASGYDVFRAQRSN